MKTVIKKTKDRNEYVLTEDRLWVRNFTKRLKSYDLNNLVKSNEFNLLANNEAMNARLHTAFIDVEKVFVNKMLILSDGYDFKERVKYLAKLPKDVKVIATNGCLNKIPNNVRVDYYVVNNPYPECLSYLSNINKVPRVIASVRTYPQFMLEVKKRNILMFKYRPTPNKQFGSSNCVYTIDDYRNPICASIFLANRFGANKIVLFCCDESFEGERPAAELLPNGLYTYPQHFISANLIDAMIYWLRQANIEVGDASSGPKLKNAAYITPNEIGDFFRDDL